MPNPYISVIIPVYNRTQYVGDAINSVLSQTLDKDKYEIIVITNVDLPEKERVRIIKSNERWQGPMVAQCIEEARGEVISLLDDDDLFLPDKLEVVYKVFRENEKLGLLKNPIKYRNEYGKEWLGIVPKEALVSTPNDLNIDKISEFIFKYGVGVNSSSMSFRKIYINDYLSYLREIKLAVDNFIGFVFLFTNQVMIWNQPLSIYRVKSNSASHKLASLDQYIEHAIFFLKINYEDDIVTYNAIKNSNFAELFEKRINYKKIAMKFWSKNPGEVKLTWREILNAAPLHNPRIPKWKVLAYYLASYLPYFLKKKLVFERLYKRELKKYTIHD
mgnify:CR=1 FL=1